jgi:proteic killer suppression protein
LEKCYASHKQASRLWGAVVAKRYIQRIDMIQETADLNALCQLPGLNCHPLKGDRKSEYAISLTGFWRLIFTVYGNRFEIAMVEEVSKHYDD